MDYIIATLPLSSEICEIPNGVYDVDSLRAGCKILGIATDRATIRRFRRGLDLHENGAIQEMDNTRYVVQSQTNPDSSYTVLALPDGKFSCDCPDFARPEIQICKHIIAVRIWQHEYNRHIDSCCPPDGEPYEPVQYYEWNGEAVPF